VAWGAVLAIAVDDMQIRSNSCTGGCCDHSEGGFPPPLLVSSTRPDEFWVTGVSISGNTGWESTPVPATTAWQRSADPGRSVGKPVAWARLGKPLETACPSYSEHWKTDYSFSRRMHWHTVEADGVELTNFLRGVGCLGPSTTPAPF
jgi:hypothetical protein